MKYVVIGTTKRQSAPLQRHRRCAKRRDSNRLGANAHDYQQWNDGAKEVAPPARPLAPLTHPHPHPHTAVHLSRSPAPPQPPQHGRPIATAACTSVSPSAPNRGQGSTKAGHEATKYSHPATATPTRLNDRHHRPHVHIHNGTPELHPGKSRTTNTTSGGGREGGQAPCQSPLHERDEKTTEADNPGR